MQPTVTSKQCQAAKHGIIQQIEQGASVRQARLHCTVLMHRTTVYRLLKRVQREGESALAERRHGHQSSYVGTSSPF